MAIETVGFGQIATAATPKGAVLSATAGGTVYEYNCGREERYSRLPHSP